MNDISEVNNLLDIKKTCERSDQEKLIFLGSLSPFSNLHPATFRINNTEFSSSEQYIQSEKAKLFNDDIAHSRIMHEKNPYRIKKLGSRIRGFNLEKWRRNAQVIVHKAVYVKFNQNSTLKRILLNTGEKLLAEASPDSFWGIGLHLHNKPALNRRAWPNTNGGIMMQILTQVCQELK